MTEVTSDALMTEGAAVGVRGEEQRGRNAACRLCRRTGGGPEGVGKGFKVQMTVQTFVCAVLRGTELTPVAHSRHLMKRPEIPDVQSVHHGCESEARSAGAANKPARGRLRDLGDS